MCPSTDILQNSHHPIKLMDYATLVEHLPQMQVLLSDVGSASVSWPLHSMTMATLQHRALHIHSVSLI